MKMPGMPREDQDVCWLTRDTTCALEIAGQSCTQFRAPFRVIIAKYGRLRRCIDLLCKLAPLLPREKIKRGQSRTKIDMIVFRPKRCD